MTVEFCQDNSGSAQKMRYFRKNRGAGAVIRRCNLFVVGDVTKALKCSV